jgi:hypothetical protein
MADSIKCPHCHTEIPLSQVISHQIDEQLEARVAHELASQRAQLRTEAAEREQELRSEWEADQAERDERVRREAVETAATDLAELTEQVEKQSTELAEARTRELAWRRKERELDEARENLELEVARRLDEERTQIATAARQSANEQHQIDKRQQETRIEQLQKQIKELQESAEGASSGLIGEAQEREIEDVLAERFRADRIEPIKAGQRGADVLQTVVSRRGESCGKILWESKRARNWSGAWIPKLKEDQGAAGADVAVLVCSALPADVRHMELVDGVWVVSFACVIPIASAMREALVGITQARSIDANRNQSLSRIYDYLTSNEFNRHMRAIVEGFVEMNDDLDRERRAMEKNWSRRRKQIDGLALNTAAIYGDLEGIIGPALPTIERLELPAPVVAIRSAG